VYKFNGAFFSSFLLFSFFAFFAMSFLRLQKLEFCYAMQLQTASAKTPADLLPRQNDQRRFLLDLLDGEFLLRHLISPKPQLLMPAPFRCAIAGPNIVVANNLCI